MSINLSNWMNNNFNTLKKKFIKSDEEINLQSTEGEDFNSYVLSKIKGVQNMIHYKGMSKIEREAAGKWIKKMLLLDQAKKNS